MHSGGGSDGVEPPTTMWYPILLLVFVVVDVCLFVCFEDISDTVTRRFHASLDLANSFGVP